MAEPELMTVPELAALLRIKERKVYDLAASGAVPVTRVTGKLLFPAAEVRAWIAGGQDGAKKGGGVPGDGPVPELVLGSHDPLLDWALRQSGSGLAVACEGSGDGLRRFARGGGILSGLHLPEAGGWNVGAVAEVCAGRNAALIHWAKRRRGLVLRRGLDGVAGVADLAGLRLVPRQDGSGSQQLWERLLSEAGLAQTVAWAEIAPSEHEAVMAVAQGQADAALGLESLAAAMGLSFVPLMEESFDLLVDRAAWFGPALQRFWAFCGTAAFRDHAGALAGYDLRDRGKVRWNG